ncbi:MAG TPA: hypothetical protein VIP06_03560 [Nocardioides sp.]
MTTEETPTAPTLTKRRVVLDLMNVGKFTATYANPDDDASPTERTVMGLPVIYLNAEDFRALGEREQVTITIEPGDLLNDEEAEEVTCPNCGRDHIPDEYEGQTHDVCVECLDGRGDDE